VTGNRTGHACGAPSKKRLIPATMDLKYWPMKSIGESADSNERGVSRSSIAAKGRRLWPLKLSANLQKAKVPEAGSEGEAVVWLAKDSLRALHSKPEPSFAGVFGTLA